MVLTGTPPDSPEKAHHLGQRNVQQCIVSDDGVQSLQPPMMESSPISKKNDEKKPFVHHINLSRFINEELDLPSDRKTNGTKKRFKLRGEPQRDDKSTASHESIADSIAELTVQLARSISDSFLTIHNGAKEAATKVSDAATKLFHEFQEHREPKEVTKSNKENVPNTNHLKHTLSVLLENECQACILSSSDQHITFLLTNITLESHRNLFRKNKNETNHMSDPTQTKSLLKMSLVSSHKRALSKTDPQSDPLYNKKILAFLSRYRFDLISQPKSESLFFKATPRIFLSSKVFAPLLSKKILPQKMHNANDEEFFSIFSDIEGFDVELVSPASDSQIKKEMFSEFRLVEETPELFKKVILPHIQREKEESKSLNPINNTIQCLVGDEYQIADTDSYVMSIDAKWISHPDPWRITQDKWYNHPSVNELHCVAVPKDNEIATLRDLRSKHTSMLESILSDGCKLIEEKYGLEKDQVLVFVRYHPKFYHFRVNFTSLQNTFECNIEDCYLLRDIIQNLKSDNEFYYKRTMWYILNEAEDLYQCLRNNEKVNLDGSLEFQSNDTPEEGESNELIARQVPSFGRKGEFYDRESSNNCINDLCQPMEEKSHSDDDWEAI